MVINILSNRSEWTFYFLSSVQFNFTISEYLILQKISLINATPKPISYFKEKSGDYLVKKYVSGDLLRTLRLENPLYYPNATEDELRKVIWEKIKEINKTFPPYKYIKNMIITDKPLIKTTTHKIKRKEELALIEGK